jgi:hypothetical protein
MDGGLRLAQTPSDVWLTASGIFNRLEYKIYHKGRKDRNGCFTPALIYVPFDSAF